jgi:hypothetical protein
MRSVPAGNVIDSRWLRKTGATGLFQRISSLRQTRGAGRLQEPQPISIQSF